MRQFPIRRVDRSSAQSVEPLGSKPKFWFRDGSRRLLFKANHRGNGEDWAEVVADQLCRRLGLPHVEYEFAIECDGASDLRPGVVCENMAPKPFTLVLGNELLFAVDQNYPSQERFKVKQHTVESVGNIVEQLFLPPEKWIAGVPAGIQRALDVFVGYVMLDAWIANQDRHHENWGALWDGNELRLAPTFDHGAALGRNLLDSEREERLQSRVKNRTVLTFTQRGQSKFFESASDTRPLGLCEAILAFSRRATPAAELWLERLRAVNRQEILGIIERVPVPRMSAICREFTLQLLLTNQSRLLNRKEETE